eukprot:gene51744-16835_t
MSLILTGRRVKGPEALRLGIAQQCYVSPNQKEGPMAFSKKRAPKWQAPKPLE